MTIVFRSVLHLLLTTYLVALKSRSFVESSSEHLDNHDREPPYIIRKEDLCPYVDATLPGRELDTANHPYKAIFKFFPYENIVDYNLSPVVSPHHCFFYSDGPNKRANVAQLRSLRFSSSPWPFDSKTPACEDHIKISSDGAHQCKAPFHLVGKNHSNKSLGTQQYSFLAWSGPQAPLDISFPSFVASANLTRNSTHPWAYLHLLYVLLLGDGVCSLRVQQHAVVLGAKTTTPMDCSPVFAESMQLCGEYHCSEMGKLLESFQVPEDDFPSIYKVWKAANEYKSPYFFNRYDIPVGVITGIAFLCSCYYILLGFRHVCILCQLRGDDSEVASGIRGIRSDSIDFHEPLQEVRRGSRAKSLVSEPPPSYSSAEASPPTYEQAVEVPPHRKSSKS